MNFSLKKGIEPPEEEGRSSSSSSSCCIKNNRIKDDITASEGRKKKIMKEGKGMEPPGTTHINISSSSSTRTTTTTKKTKTTTTTQKSIMVMFILCIYSTLSTLLTMTHNSVVVPLIYYPSKTIHIIHNDSSLNIVPAKDMNSLLSLEQQQQQQQQQQNKKSSVPQPSFKISDHKPCVTPKVISSEIDMMETAYYQGNIRIFPRNGYLLGAIRHSGFLPHEHDIDADLAVMYEDIIGKYDIYKPFQLKSNKTSITYTFTPEVQFSKWITFNGHDPITKERYKFLEMKITGDDKDRSKFMVDCIFPYYDNDKTGEKQALYPLYAVKGYNLIGSLRENERYRNEGGSVFVLGHGNENKSIVEECKGQCNVGTIFQSKWFDELTHKPFYDQHMLVPIGYHGILEGFYGPNYMHVEKRKGWEAIPVSQEDNDRYLKYGPLPMCSWG